MKTVRVAAAVICDSFAEKKQIFATAKGYGPFKGKWEFPGGKIEEGETVEEALRREIGEELDVEILVGDFLSKVKYDYPNFHLDMDCFWCELGEGAITLVEAEEGRWLTKDTLYDVDWLPADMDLIRLIEKEMGE